MNRIRITAGLAALAVACTAFGGDLCGFVQPCQVMAADEEQSACDWIYEETEGGVKLTEYTGNETEVTIPEMLGLMIIAPPAWKTAFTLPGTALAST